MIRTGKTANRQEFPGEGAQAPLHPVADDGAADLLGNGVTDTNGLVAISAVADQQDKSGRGCASAGVGRQEICAFAKGD